MMVTLNYVQKLDFLKPILNFLKPSVISRVTPKVRSVEYRKVPAHVCTRTSVGVHESSR